MSVSGRETNLAFAKFGSGSWGVAASVTKGLYWSTSADVMRLLPNWVEDNRMNQSFLGQAEIGDINPVDSRPTGQARYDDYHYILHALAMGSPAAVAISTSASGQTTSWTHQIDLSANIDGLGITLAEDKVLYVDELRSAKVVGFGETFGDGGVVNDSFHVVGDKATEISSINTRSTVNGATFPAVNGRIFRKQGVFRINAFGAGSLTTGTDDYKIESWDWSIDRPQDNPHVTSQDYILDPADNGQPTFAIRITFPRMTTSTANSFYAFLRQGSLLKADMTYSGAYINSTDQYTRKWEFPALELHEWQAPNTGPNQIKPVGTFVPKLAPTSPTGMAFVNPVRLTYIKVNSVHAFA